LENPSRKVASRTLAAAGLLAALVVAIATQAAAAVTFGPELVVNGGFEAEANVQQPTGWTFIAAPEDSRAAAVQVDPHSGNNSYFFGSGGNYDQLSQVIATDPFAEYRVQAWVKVDNFLDPDSISNSLLSGFGPYNFFLVQQSPDASYVLIEKTILALSASTELTLFGANKSGNFYVDDVSVRRVISAVPEPSTWALLIVGFAGAGAMVRRSRRIRGAIEAAALVPGVPRPYLA
jgi:hypothetical protein